MRCGLVDDGKDSLLVEFLVRNTVDAVGQGALTDKGIHRQLTA